MLTPLEINAPEDVRDELLRERYNKGNSPTKTRAFVVSIDGAEAGLLIFEDWGPPESIIYEVFVLRHARGQGVGSWMLSHAEHLAALLGRTSVKLMARPLDRDEQGLEFLIAWYERKGYVRSDVEDSWLRKRLTQTAG